MCLAILLATALASSAHPARTATPGPGEADIWYLGHCGYAVRTQNHFLVFDYQEQRDGPAPRVHEDQWHYGRQNAEFFRRFRPHAVFPMHDSAEAVGYREAARAWQSRTPGLPVFVPERLGERFVHRGGTLTRAAAGDGR
jgi:hypothetical protein